MIVITKKDILWSYLGQIFKYGSSFIILPIILIKLPSNDLALWYLFISITAFVNLLDFGFHPNTSRFVSYIFGGATELLKEGLSTKDKSLEIKYTLLKSLIYTLKRVYLNISIIAFFVLSIGGSLYLLSAIDESQNTTKILSAWFLYLTSNVLTFYYGYYGALLEGRGLITSLNKVLIFSKLSYLIIAFITLSMGLGLLGVAIASLIGNIVDRVLAYYYFYDSEIKKEFMKISDYHPENLFKIIWYNSKKIGIVTIGVFMISQSSVIIAGIYLPLAEVAVLGLTLQIFGVLQNISRVSFNTHIPQFNSLRMSENFPQLKLDFKKSMIFGWIVYSIGLLILLFLGKYILGVIGSNTDLPSRLLLLLFGFVFLMEITHGNCATFLTTKNTIPFVKPTIITGILNIIFIILFLNFSELGLYSFPVSLILVQLMYNAWKWPLEVLKDLNYFKSNTNE
ncbi:O-unit flippase-like protein [Confluentibacter citreus]|uniref:O-unit flippase-like protein n=1 Tax=Confluentibacter citreus TaxID=2007307 RepID=UPI000C281F0B|nr:O-unit flippase-like protein [Confluentibacter citreus]